MIGRQNAITLNKGEMIPQQESITQIYMYSVIENTTDDTDKYLFLMLHCLK